MLDSVVGARMHTDHCIEALRISLSCHGDTTPYFNILDPNAPLKAQTDFTPQRKCRDFGRLQAWVVENRMSDPREDHGLRLDDQVQG